MKFRLVFKIASLLTLIVLSLAVVAVVVLLYTDPNKIKDQIENLAARQGIELDLYGDIHWAFFPNVDLQVSGANAGYETENATVKADIKYLSLSLKTVPALRGDFEFVGIEITGGDFDITTKPEDRVDTSSESSDDIIEQLSRGFDDIVKLMPQVSEATISRLALRDLRVQFSSEVRQQQSESNASIGQDSQSVEISELIASDMSATGAPFKLKGQFQLSSLPDMLQGVVVDSSLTIDAKSKIVDAEFARLEFHPDLSGDEPTISSDGRIKLDLTEKSWSLRSGMADSGALGMSANLSGMLSPPSGEGRISVNLTDMPAWLTDASPDGPGELPVDMFVLDSVAMITDKSVELRDMRFRVDKSAGTGFVNYRYNSQKRLSAKLQIDSLDTNSYVNNEPNTEEPNQAEEASTPIISEEAIDLLRSFDLLDVQLNIGQLSFADRALQDGSMSAEFQRGVGTLALSTPSFAGGAISADIGADFSKSSDIDLALKADAVRLSELSPPEAKNNDVGGLISFDFEGRIDNVQRQDLQRGLNGKGQFSFDDLQIRSMNIEQVLCESAELLGASSAIRSVWDAGTLLGDINNPFAIADGVFSSQAVSFQYGNMSTVSDARFDLLTSDLNMGMKIAIDGTKTSEEGCSLNKYIRGARLPMQCSGRLGAEDAISCGLDKGALKQLAVREAGNQIVNRLLDELGGSNDEETELDAGEQQGQSDQDTVDQLSDSVRDEVRGALKGLLDRLGN